MELQVQVEISTLKFEVSEALSLKTWWDSFEFVGGSWIILFWILGSRLGFTKFLRNIQREFQFSVWIM